MHVHVAIIGLDRTGASIGLALKRYQNQSRAEHTFTIIGSDTKGMPMKSAEKMGAVDNFNRALLKATDNADLVFVNVPYGDLPDSDAAVDALADAVVQAIARQGGIAGASGS